MKEKTQDVPMSDLIADGIPEMKLSDDDVLDAMRHIAGYLDITTEDFLAIYHLAHHHAVGRLFGGVKAERLMRSGIEPLHADLTMFAAANAIARSGYKGLPVVDANGLVVGMLTETDFLRRLKADSFLGLLLRMLDDTFEFTHSCHETPVSAAMTTPARTVTVDAGFVEIMKEFRNHEGRSMPVVGGDRRMRGLLLRKDFLAACSQVNVP
jgi:CBS domain-containing membrane protein